ncbi:PepSY domain-containing protein [Calothrix sp. CCY 0018]|uniref:PepSY domain-containing protein n=1 Tax=Calothrix sp. CCY 0018 TaxID=3103864 RepID=UPI0039C6A878
MSATKIIALAAVLASTLGFAGLARNVSAQQTESQLAVNNRESTEIAQAIYGDGETDDDAEEQQETAKYQSLTKITFEQAKQAAEAAVGGKAKKVELENEDGNLVYEVEIGKKEVIVDAGNGKVLYTENEDREDDEATEANRPKSSIQVPYT